MTSRSTLALVLLPLTLASLAAPAAGRAPGAALAQPSQTQPSPAPMVALKPAAGSAAGVTKVDAAAGWTALDGGKDFRGYKQPGFPAKGWTVEGGVLKSVAGAEGAADLVTAGEYGDFELTFAFRCTPKANSGVMWRVGEQGDTTWQTGAEFQILEDATHGAKPTDMHSCGAMYDLYPPSDKKTMNPAGEWNQGRIRLKDGVVQHWLNGVKLVEARIDGAEWKEKIAGSKFKSYKGFGVLPKGRIALQHHGDEVWFKDIKIRDLGGPLPGQVALFDGKGLDAWTFFLNDNGKMEDVWSISEGVLICKGNPVGYIRTKQDYTNYVLKLEWRFNPVTKKAGNSGVLLRMIGPDKVWPKSVEAQLHSENAGDFWNIENYVMTADAARTKGRNTKKTHMAERPVGEWNEYEIIVSGGEIVLKVNGEELNRATGVEQNAGKICLQSEGAEIHFRNIRVAPLE